MTTAFDISVLAPRYAQIALLNVQQEYPNKLDHVMNDAKEVRSPRDLHPAFYGSFDWHSSVHMHWLLVRLLRSAPDFIDHNSINTILDSHLSPLSIAGEIAYLNPAYRSSFERTYGWAWLLKLQTELILLSRTDAKAASWSVALQPLTDCFIKLYLEFLPRLPYPIRSGTHSNSAWGLLFALGYAETCGHHDLSELVQNRAYTWYAQDRRYPASFEPGGEDFLSAGLLEAVLMRRVLKEKFGDWWHEFCPDHANLVTWFTPITDIDRSDPRLCHLDGLNLSRAWCWKQVVDALPRTMQDAVKASIKEHLFTSLPHAGQGAYVGTHWLASFATLALTEPAAL